MSWVSDQNPGIPADYASGGGPVPASVCSLLTLAEEGVAESVVRPPAHM